MTNGETNLQRLLANCQAKRADDIFVFLTLKDRDLPDGISPQMMFQEAEGTSYIIRQSEAEATKLAYDYPCVMITLSIHSSLEAVGFMAHISQQLARAGISVNPVAGYYHDHLFVPVEKAEEAMAVLAALTS